MRKNEVFAIISQVLKTLPAPESREENPIGKHSVVLVQNLRETLEEYTHESFQETADDADINPESFKNYVDGVHQYCTELAHMSNDPSECSLLEGYAAVLSGQLLQAAGFTNGSQ